MIERESRSHMKSMLFNLMLLVAAPLAAVEPFHAPAVPSGSIDVVLHATETVTANTPVVASFGVPFPRGSISASALANLRVLSSGVEIPAYVIALTPWRHRSNVAIDGQSVRVTLVQVEVSFANTAQPKTIVVEWGGPVRTLNRPARALRATTWHQVTSGSFVAADNVFEPNVLAQLPPAWLSQGVLRATRALPFDASNTAVRDDPAAMDAITTWPGTQEAERALKNNFYTVINQDDPLVTSLIAYKTTREPWLYDRSATMFSLYFRSGSVKALREAIRSTDFYRTKLNAAGAFTIESGDSKYSYNESLAYAFWSTGDATFLPAISATADVHNASPSAWTAALNFWTERMIAFKLMAHAIDYEVTGSVARRDSVNAIVQGLVDHQNGAALPIPMQGRIDGGWYHTGNQHDATEMPGALYGASSWMTALVSDALRRAYATAEDLPTAHMIRRTGTFLKGTLRNQVGQYDGASTWAPRYIIEWDGTDFAPEVQEADPLHEEEHALETASALAWAEYFGALTNQRDPSLAAIIDDVYDTYDLGVNFWIRPAAPGSAGLAAFRVNPPRKWGWEHRTSDGLSWAIAAAATPAELPVFANGFE
jgi:hypothetical protein